MKTKRKIETKISNFNLTVTNVMDQAKSKKNRKIIKIQRRNAQRKKQ